MSDTVRTNKIEDAGEFIAGARKDWHLNAMSRSDIEAMTDEEIVLNVKKDNIWPKPDYEKLVDNGMEPKAAALVKIIRDQMAQTPGAWRGIDPMGGRKSFVDLIGFVRDVATACKTVQDVAEIYRRYEDYTKENNFGNDKWVIYKSNRSPLHLNYNNVRKAEDMIKAGFPAKENDWKRNLKVVKGWGGFTLLRSKTVLKGNFESEEAAWEWAKENANKRAPKKTDGKTEPKRPHLERLERTGLFYDRQEIDITPEDFLETFGFRGIQFGNWLPDSERQQVLNLGYEALMDLSEVMNWEPKALSLDGTLGLAFGARGTGRAAAHYEPGQRVINMTKLSGAGSLAHEFAHALDHWLGTGTTVQVPGGIPSASGWDTHGVNPRMLMPHRDESIGIVCEKTLQSIYKRNLSKEEKLERLSDSLEWNKKEFEKYSSIAQKAAESGQNRSNKKYLKDLNNWLSEKNNHIKYLEETIEQINNGTLVEFGSDSSNYYNEAKKLCGTSDYYRRPNELFARAFESWVFDEVRERDGLSDYLVHGVEDGQFAGDEYKGDPYPSGIERKIIGSHIKEIVATVKPEAEFNLETSATPRM